MIISLYFLKTRMKNLLLIAILGLVAFPFITGSPVSVNFPPAQCLSVSGGTTITITGTSYASSGNTAIVNLSTVGNLTCTTTTLPSTFAWTTVCQVPSHSISSALDLKVWLVVNGVFWGSSFTQTGLLTYQTQITSAYPTSLSLGGGSVLTVYGCFDTTPSAYTYLEIGPLAAIYSTNWVSISNNAIVVIATTCGNNPMSNLALTVAWGSGPYTQLTNAVNYVYPQLISTFPTLPLPGDSLTITGTNFGTSKSWWNYAQIASLPAVYSSDTNWISITDTQIVIHAPSCGEAPLTNQILHLGWGIGSYATLTNAVNYAYPTVVNYVNIARLSGGIFSFDLYGSNFGPVDNNYWSNVAVGPIGGCNPQVIANGHIIVYCVACGGVTNVAVALHWYAVDYVLGPATFSIAAGDWAHGCA
jgi:hypothetical protein